MKKKLVTYLLIAAMAAVVFSGCSKKEAEGDAAGGEAAVTEQEAEAEAPEGEAVEAEAETGTEAAAETEAAVEEAAAEAEAGVAEAADTAVEAVEEAAEEEGEEFKEEISEEAAAAMEDAAPAESEDLIVDPGTMYTVRFGGNIYSTMEENDANIMYYATPGNVLQIDERLENYWYKVTYYLTGEGIAHQGYIKIQ